MFSKFQRRPQQLAWFGAGVTAMGLSMGFFYVMQMEQRHRATAGPPSLSRYAGVRHRPVDESPSKGGTNEDDVLESTEGSGVGSLLPRGISEIDGSGGEGVHRAVLKNGVWFPVFSPGAALLPDGSAGYAPRASVPLAITTGTPAPGKTGVTFICNFNAIGGTPPYRWSFLLGADASNFTMNPVTGQFLGLSPAALSTSLDVFVTDQAGEQASAHYPLLIAEEKPLALVTADLPGAMLGNPYATRLEATGGTAPYRWFVAGLEAAGLLLTPNTGELSGTPDEPGDFEFLVTVTDQKENVVSASLALSITGTAPSILTNELADATVGAGYSAQLSAEGGTPPYHWTMATAAPSGLSLDSTTGTLSGTPKNAGEFNLDVTLTDQFGETATKTLDLKVVNGLDITTSSPLFPASPQLAYQVSFAATGGQPPYQWSLEDGKLPVDDAGRAWTLTPDGMLSGVAGSVENIFRFSIEVRDDTGRTFSKAFELPLRQGLIAISSRERIGLAWRANRIDAALRSSGSALAGVILVRGAGGFPQTTGAGVMVFQGAGNNVVDHNLQTGGTYFYTLFAITVDGRTIPYSTAMAAVLPMTLQRAATGATGDPHADRVASFQPLSPGGFGSTFVPGNLTGPPDGKGTFAPASGQNEVASLHAKAGAGGSVVVEFTNNIVELGNGPDFTVFENVLFIGGDASQRFMEPAMVWVALFDDEWYRFPIDVVPSAGGQPLNLMNPFYYNKGFAGRNGTTGSDPTNPTVSGGDSFDIDELAIPGLTWIRYIRIQSTGDNAINDDFGGDPVRHTSLFNGLSGDRSSGFDLDAVSAANY